MFACMHDRSEYSHGPSPGLHRLPVGACMMLCDGTTVYQAADIPLGASTVQLSRSTFYITLRYDHI